MAVLSLVASIITVAATLNAFGHEIAAVILTVVAMGAENAAFESDGEVHIGLTYMTGTLVKFGQRIAEAVNGGRRFAWAPYLFLWIGLVLGAVAGAATYLRLGLGGLWIAAGFAFLLTIGAALTNDDAKPMRA